MKSQKIIGLADLLRRRWMYIGETLEHIAGDCDLRTGKIVGNWDVWRGTLFDFKLDEYSTGPLLTMRVRRVSRLVALRERSRVTEDCESCDFSVDPNEFRIYEWSDGEISLQAGQTGLDQVFTIRPSIKLLR